MFTQKNSTNIKQCLHCKHNYKCKLGYQKTPLPIQDIEYITDEVVRFIGGPTSTYKPTINDKIIDSFIDINGTTHTNTERKSAEEAFQLLREKILPACDYYEHKKR